MYFQGLLQGQIYLFYLIGNILIPNYKDKYVNPVIAILRIKKKLNIYIVRNM
jgi:hypothetical protein